MYGECAGSASAPLFEISRCESAAKSEGEKLTMRLLTDHIVEGDSANHQLSITVTDTPGQGGANHRYEVGGLSTESNSSRGELPAEGGTVILFQNGPIKEFGVNGITQEALLAIVMDRLRAFQAGPFSCEANAKALSHCSDALYHLQTRTRERIRRGVEGTHAA